VNGSKTGHSRGHLQFGRLTLRDIVLGSMRSNSCEGIDDLLALTTAQKSKVDTNPLSHRPRTMDSA